MTLAVVIAVDQGTTSVRASVFDVHGGALRLRSACGETTARSFPRPGWVEIDAAQVVAATERVIAAAMDAAGCAARDVVGLGLANQGETVVVWDRRTGAPIAPAIGWQCRRTEEVCARLRASGDLDWTLAATGLRLDPYFSATKIAWILDEIPGARARADRGELVAGTLDTFTLARLSEGRILVTDPSTSCRTLLAELTTGRFSDRLCEAFRVPRRILAEVVASDATAGRVRIAGGETTARALLCDQPSALLGTGCLAPGDVKCTYGTGAFLQVNSGASCPKISEEDGLLRSIAWELGGARHYLLEGSVLAAGDVLTWLRDGLGLLERPDEIEAVLAATPDSAGVLFVPALTGLGAPRWVGEARGTVFGLHRGARREHVLRAALEGIAHQVADVLDAAASSYRGELAPLWADGGLTTSTAFLELQADLAGRVLLRSDEGEATTRGVAAVAAVGAGLAESVAGLVEREPAAIVAPRMNAAVRAALRERHRRAVDLVTSAEALSLGR